MKPVPYYVLALAMGIPAMLVGVEIPSWLFLGSQTMALQSDLRVPYTAGYMLRSGQARDIYNFPVVRRNQDERVARDGGAVPFLHPAYEVLAFVPLSFLPYRAAYLVWAGINFAVLGLTYFSLRPCLAGLSAVGPDWIPPALLLGFMPVAFTILAGQDSLLLLLILVLTYRRIGSNELQAGMLFALGMFRFQVLLPIVILFLVWRSFRFVAGWALGSAAVLSISVAITGLNAQVQHARLLQQMANVSIWLLLRRMPNLRGLFAALDFGMVPLVLVSLCVLLAAAAVGARCKAPQRLLLAISVSALATYYLFLHDLSVLALPLLVTLSDRLSRRDWPLAALASAALSGFAVLWFASDRFYLGALLTSLFFCTQLVGLWKQSGNTAVLPECDS